MQPTVLGSYPLRLQVLLQNHEIEVHLRKVLSGETLFAFRCPSPLPVYGHRVVALIQRLVQRDARLAVGYRPRNIRDVNPVPLISPSSILDAISSAASDDPAGGPHALLRGNFDSHFRSAESAPSLEQFCHVLSYETKPKDCCCAVWL